MSRPDAKLCRCCRGPLLRLRRWAKMMAQVSSVVSTRCASASFTASLTVISDGVAAGVRLPGSGETPGLGVPTGVSPGLTGPCGDNGAERCGMIDIGGEISIENTTVMSENDCC